MQQPTPAISGPDLVDKAPIAPGSTHPSRGMGLPLPHERDESVSSMASELDPKIVQAKRDLDAGMVDTDMYATPGLDAELRKKMVPGPGGEINDPSRAEKG